MGAALVMSKHEPDHGSLPAPQLLTASHRVSGSDFKARAVARRPDAAASAPRSVLVLELRALVADLASRYGGDEEGGPGISEQEALQEDCRPRIEEPRKGMSA